VKKAKRYTVDDILAMNPCERYTRSQIVELSSGKSSVTANDAAKAKISNADKGWILGHMLPWPSDFIFPEGVKDLWVDNNPALTELKVPEGVEELYVYNNPALTELKVPEGVKELRVCNNLALTELKVPEGVKDLWVCNNPALAELKVPEGVKDLYVDNNPALTD